MLKKLILMLSGLFIMALAMAFLSAADLGISPVQSLAYVLSNKFPDFLSFGVASGAWNIILVVVQIALLRRNFRLWELLQIPLSLYFAVVIDLARKIVTVSPETYPARILTMLLGIVILAFGISLTLRGNLVMNSGEATVKALAEKTKKSFGNVKVVFDLSIVASAVAASFIFFGRFRFDMIGIGTLCSACMTGFLVKGMTKLMERVGNELRKSADRS